MKKTKSTAAAEETAANAKKAKAKCLLNVRETPNTHCDIVRVLELGEEINTYEESGAWKHTDDGWCMSAYLEDV